MVCHVRTGGAIWFSGSAPAVGEAGVDAYVKYHCSKTEAHKGGQVVHSRYVHLPLPRQPFCVHSARRGGRIRPALSATPPTTMTWHALFVALY
jgi:hypothetical protein